MAEALIDILDRADSAIARANQLASDGGADPAAFAVQRVRSRLQFPDDVVIVALAGGTGSGKSSLFNALVDGDEARVSGLRPTTSVAMVSLPRSIGGVVDDYLAEFGDLHRVTHDEPVWLVLMDLPDTDSVEVDHQVTVRNILPKVDMVIWVADIEKYRDASLHRHFLRSLTIYENQFLFVLNQVDRVPEAEVDKLLADFESALKADGFGSPQVLASAANPPIGPRRVDDVGKWLTRTRKTSLVEKVTAELRSALADLVSLVGERGSGFSTSWQTVRDTATALVVGGEPLAASRTLSAYLVELADGLTGVAAEKALELGAVIGEELTSIEGVATSRVERDVPRWQFWGSPTEEHVDPDVVARRLDAIVDRELRPILQRRAEIVAELTSISIDLERLSSADDR